MHDYYLPFTEMRVFHGSAKVLEGGLVKPKQANTYKDSGVPESELREAIYATPEIGYAIAMAARPEGRTEIDELNRSITFDNPEKFDPEKEIYIYELETDELPKESVEYVDELQIALHLPEGIKPVDVHKFKAKEVMNYYELTNYKKESENLEPSNDWNSLLRK